MSWVAQRAVVFRIRAGRDACIDCKGCAKAYPSSVMSAILEDDRLVVRDCFPCGTCLEVCPTGAACFEAGRRRPTSGRAAA